MTSGLLASTGATAATQKAASTEKAALAPAVIPKPASLRTVPGHSFTLAPDTTITLDSDQAGVRDAADALAGLLRPSTGYPLPIVARGDPPADHTIRMRLVGADSLGDEGYRLDVAAGVVSIAAHRPAGLFYGAQTLRQLFPPEVESRTARPGPWTVQGVHITDRPRFAWRGAMLDVARHFFGVGDVERYIDLLSEYKINVLHLHLTDDQGWRIQIDSWPRLARYGGSTQVGGGPGGYYTKADYAEIVRYAGQHHVMVVPEIDMPGHINAALASYGQLSCDGKAPPLYTGTDVGFSSLCIDKDLTYKFVDDVVGELAAMTPGPYLHIGGDEAHATPHDDYVRFVDRVSRIVAAHGKTMIGWEEIARAHPAAGSIAQHWRDGSDALTAVRKNLKVLLSPAEKAYLDMKYDEDTPLGLSWAGCTGAEDSYEWDPGTWVEGLPPSAVVGAEAPVWSETLEDIEDVEYLAFPRLAAIAELAWSPAEGRSWAECRKRLGAQGPRWDEQSVSYYRSPEVPWAE